MQQNTSTRTLLRNLSRFEQKLQKRILTGAVKAGAKTILDDAKANAVQDTSELKDSLKVKKMTNKQTGSKSITGYEVGISKDSSAMFYANIVEYGSESQPARPFMTTAYENNGRQAIEASKKYIQKRIDKLQKDT